MRIAISTSVLLLLLATSGSRLAMAQDLEKKRNEAALRLTTELEDLALWCAENKLYLGQHLCYELLLKLDPDHAEARKTLKYVRSGDGGWIRRPYREPGNYNEELEPEYLERYEAARGRVIAALIDALETCEEKPETGIYRQTLKDLLTIAPENVEARRLNGEARLGGKWVLIETATSKRRRQELKEAAKDALSAVPAPDKISPTDEERALGVEFKSGFAGQWWRGMATVSASELKRAVKTLDASPALFDATFGTMSRQPKGCGFYLLTGKTQANKVLEKHPAFTPARREYLIKLSAGWIPGKRIFFQWSDTPALRLDGSARMAIGILMMQAFGVDTDRGWVWEGMGLYLDYLLTGSRRTFFVTTETYTTTEREPGVDVEARMKGVGANWIGIARQLLDEGNAPDLREMTQKPVNKMKAADLVYSYALCAFFIEGHPELATKFFIYHGNREPIADTVQKVFGIPLEGLQRKFERWLRERG